MERFINFPIDDCRNFSVLSLRWMVSDEKHLFKKNPNQNQAEIDWSIGNHKRITLEWSVWSNVRVRWASQWSEKWSSSHMSGKNMWISQKRPKTEWPVSNLYVDATAPMQQDPHRDTSPVSFCFALICTRLYSQIRDGYHKGLRRFLHHQAWNGTFEISSSRQEHPHFTVFKTFLDATIEQIKAHYIGLQAEFIFTLDDVRISISEWEDRKPRNVVIPVAMKVTNSVTEQTETWNAYPWLHMSPQLVRNSRRMLSHLKVPTVWGQKWWNRDSDSGLIWFFETGPGLCQCWIGQGVFSDGIHSIC
jgi:hypothetical protein